MWQETVNSIVNWLKQQLQETRTKGFILGLSGGLDSSVCAALLRRATDNCLGLILPIESDVKDLDDASAVASALNMKTQYIDLTSTYLHLTKLLPAGEQVALGNIKARLRMVVLYYHANIHDYLVCGTGNKTEIMLGYFTKYGDGACDILPLGDLYKSEVRELARALDIPQRIIEKVPTAGLWPGQTDEEEIGFTYEEMDKALKDIEQGDIKDKTCRALLDKIESTAHKKEKPKIFYVRR